MTQKPAKTKGAEILGGIGEFLILVLLLGLTGGGGYFWGLHQRLAPVQDVPPGTPGAIAPAIADHAAAQPVPGPSTTSSSPSSTAAKPAAVQSKRKYWISSSGAEYIGSSITVKVNDTAVDNFFGPGKNVNITQLVKPGDNTVAFEAKSLGADYNKHQGDQNSTLTVQVVSGPFVQENFKQSDVLATCKRTAVDGGDTNDIQHFTGE